MHAPVTSVTGFVGHRFAPALPDAGREVTALVRDAQRYDLLAGVRVVGNPLPP